MFNLPRTVTYLLFVGAWGISSTASTGPGRAALCFETFRPLEKKKGLNQPMGARRLATQPVAEGVASAMMTKTQEVIVIGLRSMTSAE